MNTTIFDVVRAAIPNASEETCDHILWGRTPYPCGEINAQSLYKAAAGYHRACLHKMRLCEFCERPARPGEFECEICHAALERAKA